MALPMRGLATTRSNNTFTTELPIARYPTQDSMATAFFQPTATGAPGQVQFQNDLRTLTQMNWQLAESTMGQDLTAVTVDSIFNSVSQVAMVAAEKLREVNSVKVVEKPDMFEAITGVEQNNLYIVTDFLGHQLFAVQEETTCISRTCFFCCPDCKPWNMDFYDLPAEGFVEGTNMGQHFLHLERPCTCACCCLCRPTVVISDPNSGPLGRVREPRCRWCYGYNLTDPDNRELLNASGVCCESGRICRCPGFQISIPVSDNSYQHVAEVQKQWTRGDCCPCCFSVMNKYTVEFGQSASIEVKLLLISLALVVQMRHFDGR